MGGDTSALIGPAIAGILAGFQFSSVLVGLAVFAASYAAYKLAPQPEIPEQDSFNMAEKDRKLSFRQPITTRKLVYGRIRVGGPIIFLTSTEFAACHALPCLPKRG